MQKSTEGLIGVMATGDRCLLWHPGLQGLNFRELSTAVCCIRESKSFGSWYQ
jgi:hypothetical protein